MTRTAWFHCFAGTAGDMTMGALVHAGADQLAVIGRELHHADPRLVQRRDDGLHDFGQVRILGLEGRVRGGFLDGLCGHLSGHESLSEGGALAFPCDGHLLFHWVHPVTTAEMHPIRATPTKRRRTPAQSRRVMPSPRAAARPSAPDHQARHAGR
jgi:hypothetical protein